MGRRVLVGGPPGPSIQCAKRPQKIFRKTSVPRRTQQLGMRHHFVKLPEIYERASTNEIELRGGTC
eukprot:491649-Pyramimonas_sp.AAC.1